MIHDARCPNPACWRENEYGNRTGVWYWAQLPFGWVLKMLRWIAEKEESKSAMKPKSAAAGLKVLLQGANGVKSLVKKRVAATRCVRCGEEQR